MKTLTGALAQFWSNKLLWVEETLLLAVVVAAVYGWLALPVATVWHLLLHAVILVAIAAIAFFAIRMATRRLGRPKWREALSNAEFWVACITALVIGLGAPYFLIRWVPELGSLTAQAASAGVRFALGGLIFTATALWLHACAAGPQ